MKLLERSRAAAGALTLLLAVATASAQTEADPGLLQLGADVRVDWQHVSVHPSGSKTVTDGGRSGFAGKYFLLRADGNLGQGFSYSWRQRLNKKNGETSLFEATDWAYVNYSTGRWNLQGGKQMVMVGGWEYDRRPIDLYACSVYWNNCAAFELGASAGYNLTTTDQLTLQACQSPFYTAECRNMYAFNLMWSGRHGAFSPVWSANMMEYAPGRWISYIALGNRVELGRFRLEIDLMNRAASHQTYMLKDYSVMGEIMWQAAEKWNIWGKMTCDVNRSGTAADATVLDGTDMKMVAAGAEFFPIRSHRHTLRVHADVGYSWGCNANRADLWQHRTLLVDAGITWNMNFLNVRR